MEGKYLMIEAKAPGKLYIAGEYAVVEPGHPAILAAINQFITVRLTETTKQGTIQSTHLNNYTLLWTRKNGLCFVDERENPFLAITQALSTTEEYARALGCTMKYYDIDVKTELDNPVDGKKYGLGSSAAVMVATIKAILSFYNVEETPELLYKLSSLATLSLHGNGSFGDIASSCYGGWIYYSCFDKVWLKEKQQNLSVYELVHLEWPKLIITPINVPSSLNLLIGWTGSPASTAKLVSDVEKEKDEIDSFYGKFLKNSTNCVNQLKEAIETNNFELIRQKFEENRQLLLSLSQKTGVKIETSTLTSLCELALDYGAASKTSGAGGGDCGIAIVNEEINVKTLYHAWENAGIVPLPICVYNSSHSVETEAISIA